MINGFLSTLSGKIELNIIFQLRWHDSKDDLEGK